MVEIKKSEDGTYRQLCDCHFSYAYILGCPHTVAANKGVILEEDVDQGWTLEFALGCLDNDRSVMPRIEKNIGVGKKQ